jgi:hypothetical protein
MTQQEVLEEIGGILDRLNTLPRMTSSVEPHSDVVTKSYEPCSMLGNQKARRRSRPGGMSGPRANRRTILDL